MEQMQITMKRYVMNIFKETICKATLKETISKAKIWMSYMNNNVDITIHRSNVIC